MAKYNYTKDSYRKMHANLQLSMDEMNRKIQHYFDEPEQLAELFAFMDGFYDYSTRNMMLIQQQYKGAYAVAPYQIWKDFYGATVKRGEKGIDILVPTTYHVFETEKGPLTRSRMTDEQLQRAEKHEYPVTKKRSYLFGKVFDISQTTFPLERYPELYPNRQIGGDVANYEAIFAAIKRVIDNEGIQFAEWNPTLGTVKGFFNRETNEIGLNPQNTQMENILTALHEVAHATLFQENLPTEIKEYQAEMVAYLTAKHFGLEHELSSLRYLAGWAKHQDVNQQVEIIDDVRSVASYFIKSMEQDLLPLLQKAEEVTQAELIEFCGLEVTTKNQGKWKEKQHER